MAKTAEGSGPSAGSTLSPHHRLVLATGFVLAALAYATAVVAGWIEPDNRLDGATLTIVAFAALLTVVLVKPELLARFRVVEAAGIKFELSDLKEKQAQQAQQLDAIREMLPLLLPVTEQKHLRNLAGGYTAGYKGNTTLQTELRRMRSIGLITSVPGQHIAALGDGSTFDLADYVTLTEYGQHWLERINELSSSTKGSRSPT